MPEKGPARPADAETTVVPCESKPSPPALLATATLSTACGPRTTRAPSVSRISTTGATVRSWSVSTFVAAGCVEKTIDVAMAKIVNMSLSTVGFDPCSSVARSRYVVDESVSTSPAYVSTTPPLAPAVAVPWSTPVPPVRDSATVSAECGPVETRPPNWSWMCTSGIVGRTAFSRTSPVGCTVNTTAVAIWNTVNGTDTAASAGELVAKRISTDVALDVSVGTRPAKSTRPPVAATAAAPPESENSLPPSASDAVIVSCECGPVAIRSS